ncbi:hypothetical protein TH67_01260 [Campylobacter concisus]|nr:hypothetical protein TH67_01260 [Campylobacter concisus]
MFASFIFELKFWPLFLLFKLSFLYNCVFNIFTLPPNALYIIKELYFIVSFNIFLRMDPGWYDLKNFKHLSHKQENWPFYYQI